MMRKYFSAFLFFVTFLLNLPKSFCVWRKIKLVKLDIALYQKACRINCRLNVDEIIKKEFLCFCF